MNSFKDRFSVGDVVTTKLRGLTPRRITAIGERFFLAIKNETTLEYAYCIEDGDNEWILYETKKEWKTFLIEMKSFEGEIPHRHILQFLSEEDAIKYVGKNGISFEQIELPITPYTK